VRAAARHDVNSVPNRDGISLLRPLRFVISLLRPLRFVISVLLPIAWTLGQTRREREQEAPWLNSTTKLNVYVPTNSPQGIPHSGY